MNIKQLCILSDFLYLSLLSKLLYQFITTKQIKWIIYIVYSLLFITINGLAIRYIFSDLGYSYPRPYLKKYFYMDKLNMSGMPSLHAISTSILATILLLHNKCKYIEIFIITFLILSLRVYSQVHSSIQILLGCFVGSVIGYLIYIITNKSLAISILILCIITGSAIKYILSKVIHTYNNLNKTEEILPSWFDKSLVKEYKSRDKKINIIYFITKCYLLPLQKNMCLPIRLTWEQIETHIYRNIPVNWHPDIIIGLKPNGIYITKYIADLYKKPFLYVNENDIDVLIPYKNKKILVVNDIYNTQLNNYILHLKRYDYINIKTFVLSYHKKSNYNCFDISFIAYPW